jgi:hypothetical protein
VNSGPSGIALFLVGEGLATTRAQPLLPRSDNWDYRMDRCIRLAYRYHDLDVVELTVSAWNGSFGGSTRVWVGQGGLADAATLLADFPVSLEDKREVTFGAFAGGAVTLQFACIDGAGHCRLRVTMEADYDRGNLLAEHVEMLCALEPAALDQFVKQMRELNSSLTGSAVLTLQ